MSSNTQGQQFRVMGSAVEKWRREYRWGGVGGEECQKWSVIEGNLLEWKGKFTSETSCVVRTGESGTGKKTGDRIEDAEIFIGSDVN